MSTSSEQVPGSSPRTATPGPARPNQVVFMSGATEPWFQALAELILAQGWAQDAAPAWPK